MVEADGIWVVAEYENGSLAQISLELVSLGRTLADKVGKVLSVLVLGDIGEGIETLAEHGADNVFILESPHLASFDAEAAIAALSRLVASATPWALLMGATTQGQEVAPRLAARLRVGLVAECVNVDVNSDQLLVLSRPAYGGKVEYTQTIPEARPQMVTISPGTVRTKKLAAAKTANVLRLPAQVAAEDLRIAHLGIIPADLKTLDIMEAEALVCAGRGLGKDFLPVMEELAQSLGAVVAGSRVAVDEGWLPWSRQIGMTGKTVTPKLLVSCGVSGATQHTIGMKDSSLIVAINKDRGAPIMKLADVAIQADLRELLPVLIQEIRQAKTPAVKPGLD